MSLPRDKGPRSKSLIIGPARKAVGREMKEFVNSKRKKRIDVK